MSADPFGHQYCYAIRVSGLNSRVQRCPAPPHKNAIEAVGGAVKLLGCVYPRLLNRQRYAVKRLGTVLCHRSLF